MTPGAKFSSNTSPRSTIRNNSVRPSSCFRFNVIARSLGFSVYPTKDGYVAMNIAVEEHWHNLLSAMGREDLRDDPRFADNAARVANREATDALVAAWTRTLGKMEAFAIAKRHRIPLAPVRDVDEVMRDRHVHERGMLEWILDPIKIRRTASVIWFAWRTISS